MPRQKKDNLTNEQKLADLDELKEHLKKRIDTLKKQLSKAKKDYESIDIQKKAILYDIAEEEKKATEGKKSK